MQKLHSSNYQVYWLKNFNMGGRGLNDLEFQGHVSLVFSIYHNEQRNSGKSPLTIGSNCSQQCKIMLIYIGTQTSFNMLKTIESKHGLYCFLIYTKTYD